MDSGSRGEEKGEMVYRRFWSNFAQDTSLHACKNVVKNDRSIAERIWWSVILLAMIAGLLHSLGNVLASYLKFKTRTSSTVEYRESLDFPTITFCNVNSFDKFSYNISEVADDLLVSFGNLRDLVPPRPMNQTNTIPWFSRSIFEIYGNLTETVREEILIAWLENEVVDKDVFEAIYGTTGVCFSFNSNKLIEKHGVKKSEKSGHNGALELVLDIHQDKYFPGPLKHAGMLIFINDPSHRVTAVDPVINVSPGSTTFIAMTKTEYKLMPHPYSSFGSESCVDTEGGGFKNPLKYSSQYSWSACLQECLSRLTSTHCGCKTPQDIEELGLPDCSVLESVECNLHYYESVYYNRTSQRKLCQCQKPCHFNIYETKLSHGTFPAIAVGDYLVKHGVINSTEYARNNLVNVLIFYDQLAVYSIEHEPEYTLPSIIGTIGGGMGFFLGASVVTMYEVFETCFKSTRAYFARGRSQKVKNISIQPES